MLYWNADPWQNAEFNGLDGYWNASNKCLAYWLRQKRDRRDRVAVTPVCSMWCLHDSACRDPEKTEKRESIKITEKKRGIVTILATAWWALLSQVIVGKEPRLSGLLAIFSKRKSIYSFMHVCVILRNFHKSKWLDAEGECCYLHGRLTGSSLCPFGMASGANVNYKTPGDGILHRIVKSCRKVPGRVLDMRL